MDAAWQDKAAARIDQIIGWAKSGERGDYYLMDRENVDTMRDDILRAIEDVLRG